MSTLNHQGDKNLGQRTKILSGYGSTCPTCGCMAQLVCRCLRGDTRCANGHQWHECKVHGLVPTGAHHGQARESGCTCIEKQPKAKVLATITQTNPDVLVLPVLRNGELIGKMSLRREALPTDNIPFRFAIGYTVEEGKMSVYEVSLVCSEKNSKMCDLRCVTSKCHYHNTGGDSEQPCANHPAIVG